MSREILFIGKRKDNGEWIEGCLSVSYDERVFIVYDEDFTLTSDCCGLHLVADRFFEVIPETVGQFTGLLDKNGAKIFEGDIVAMSIVFPTNTINMLVQWEGSGFWLVDAGRSYMPSKNFREVVGNIYENPELLGREH